MRLAVTVSATETSSESVATVRVAGGAVQSVAVGPWVARS